VETDGRTALAAVRQSSGNRALDDAALKFVMSLYLRVRSPFEPQTGSLLYKHAGSLLGRLSMCAPIRSDVGSHMLCRAILAFIALPGVVAFAIPVAIAGWMQSRALRSPLGLLVLVPGLLLLLWSVREFYVAGRGTLAPWTPPKYLVVTGPYRYCRNPMYVGVDLILLGWTVLYRSAPLLLYAAGVARTPRWF
jgi:hypothetical protein